VNNLPGVDSGTAKDPTCELSPQPFCCDEGDTSHMRPRHMVMSELMGMLILCILLVVYRSMKCTTTQNKHKLECGPMPNLMVTLPNMGGALCSTPQSLADAHY